MALDYVKNLREIDEVGEDRSRPSVKHTPEDLQRLEVSARAADAENGRYGRYQDKDGNWAIAWQAPGPMTPLVPPRFVQPAGIRRRPGTKELLLVPVEGEPLLISPQQWVVLYEGNTDPIIADDEDFRRVMTRQDRVERDRQRVEEGEPVEDTAPEPPTQPAPIEQRSTGHPPISEHRTISVDGFIAQVLSDNARLRQELAEVWADLSAHRNMTRNAQDMYDRLREANTKHVARGSWLWQLITKAMGNDHASDDQIVDWFATLPALPGPPTAPPMPMGPPAADMAGEPQATLPEGAPRRSKLSTPPAKEA